MQNTLELEMKVNRCHILIYRALHCEETIYSDLRHHKYCSKQPIYVGTNL